VKWGKKGEIFSAPPYRKWKERLSMVAENGELGDTQGQR
jgi:hypothetical protein